MAGLALVSPASRSLLAVTAFTFPTRQGLPILIQLLDGGLWQIFTGFLSDSCRIGRIPTVILGGMRLGTFSVTEGQTNGTVFRLHVIYILRIPTFRGGISAQSLMELLMIGICKCFHSPPQMIGREAGTPRLCHEPSSF